MGYNVNETKQNKFKKHQIARARQFFVFVIDIMPEKKQKLAKIARRNK